MRIILIRVLFNLIEITEDVRDSRTCRREITDFFQLKVDFKFAIRADLRQVINRICNGNWRKWVCNAIEDKRKEVGRAMHLRGVLLDAATRGQFSAF